MSEKIRVSINGKNILTDSGNTLSEILGIEKPCGGHGKCGKCKLIAKGNISKPSKTELRLLTQNELDRGVRLACVTHVLGDCEIELISEPKNPQIVTDAKVLNFELEPTFSNYGIAIDIGTTTLAARLYDVHGKTLSETSLLNPQSRWGADVISRIEAALKGEAKSLANSIREALCNIILNLTAAIDIKKVDAVVITGNTVMLSLLSEQTVEPFSHAPFCVKRLFGETVTANDLSLSVLLPNTPIYLPPCISAFVGADIICAILATGLCGKDTAMLVDIGTNGEIVLWHNGKLIVCSTAAGPAFEGVGISMGMQGVSGAIDKVSIHNGKLDGHVIGNGTAEGICGSGLVDTVACMLDLGEIDESGLLENEPFVLREPISINQKDIRMLQLAKSAICAGLRTLINNEDLTPSSISNLYIAGGFGSYLNKESAVKIGLLPKTLSEVSEVVGNAALGGASMILLNSKIAKIAESISRNAYVLDLSTNSMFSEYYILGMLFEKAE